MCHLLLSDLVARLPLHVHHMAEERLVLLLLRDSHYLDNLLVFGQVPLLLHLAVPLLVKLDQVHLACRTQFRDL